MDIDKINRLRKLRDEIEKMIGEEMDKSGYPNPYVPGYPNPYVPGFPVYINPYIGPYVLPEYQKPYKWTITSTM